MMRKANKSMYWIVPPKSFAYNPARINVGSIGYQNLSKNVIVSSLYEVFKTTDECVDDFLWYWIKTEQFQKLIERFQEGGVRLYFYYDKFCKGALPLPSVAEQASIGNFFRTLDDAIALNKRKLDKLKELKSGYLQQIFPQAGENVPRLRFKGFKGKWEQKKLGDVAEIIGGGTPNTIIPEYWDGSINWYSPTEIGERVYITESKRRITKLGLAKSSAKILPAFKTILFTSRASIGDMAILAKDGATNQGFQSLVIKEGYDIYFTFSMGYKIKAFAFKHASGSTFLEISGKLLGAMVVLYPELEEQIVIGNFFRSLDEQISIQQNKLDKLKQLKTSYLQKMFL